jgi:hypothetical protein
MGESRAICRARSSFTQESRLYVPRIGAASYGLGISRCFSSAVSPIASFRGLAPTSRAILTPNRTTRKPEGYEVTCSLIEQSDKLLRLLSDEATELFDKTNLKNPNTYRS